MRSVDVAIPYIEDPLGACRRRASQLWADYAILCAASDLSQSNRSDFTVTWHGRARRRLRSSHTFSNKASLGIHSCTHLFSVFDATGST